MTAIGVGSLLHVLVAELVAIDTYVTVSEHVLKDGSIERRNKLGGRVGLYTR